MNEETHMTHHMGKNLQQVKGNVILSVQLWHLILSTFSFNTAPILTESFV